jgi:ABC-type antimicrobial peptide transport system permease subunit
LTLTVFGLAIGLAGAAGASRLLTTLLYGFRPGYASTAAIVSSVLAAVAALATLVPARRASRTDPMVALRQE